MQEQLEQYFAQADADKRKSMLDAIREESGETQAVKLCSRLWELRYTDPKSGRRVDLFLWELVELLCLYSTAGLMKKSTGRDARKALDALGASAAAEYGEEGSAILYEELRNAVRLYLHTCDSKSYHKRLLGLMDMKDSQWQEKVARDAWRLSVGLPRRLDMEEEFSLLSKAVKEEFCRKFENGEQLLQEREERDKRGKNKKQ